VETSERTSRVLACGRREPCALGAEPRRELRRGWLARDFGVVVGVFRDLAPRCDYRAAELAGRLQLSLRHLQRIFATTIGCAPQEWLQQQRMLAARQLLVTHRSIKETAYSLGFSSPSQFTRDFRSQFGKTPTSFLREQWGSGRTARATAAVASPASPGVSSANGNGDLVRSPFCGS